MAKRSDFAQKLLDDLRARKKHMAVTQNASHPSTTANNAQKLLDDLRARKEHMAVTQNASHPSTTANTDVISGASKHAYNGSSHAYKTTGSKTGRNTRQRSDTSNKSLAIIDIGRDKGSQHMGDQPLAITLARQNGGKLAGVDFSNSANIIRFLRQIGSGSMGSSSYIDKRSEFHVSEISKGALKLNQILRACGNDNNASIRFDKGSIEVGKKLLKGAMDLEESLRMLVSMQEASDFVIKPRQQKGRIRLIEDDDDDEQGEDVDNNNKLAVVDYENPKFSFDGPSRNSRDGSEGSSRTAGLGQRVAVLTYPAAKVQALDLSAAPDKEKKVVRNVIAQLMGLQEFPEHHKSNYTEPKKPNSSQTIASVFPKKNEQRRTENDVLKSKVPQNLENQMVNQKAIQSKKMIDPGSIAAGRDLEHSTQTAARLRNAGIKTDKERNSFANRNNGSTVKSGTRVLVSNDEPARRGPVPHTYKTSEAASVSIKKINQTGNQHKRGNGKGLHKNNTSISPSRGGNHVADVKGHQAVNPKSPVTTQNKNELPYTKTTTTKTIQDILDLQKRAPQQVNQFVPDNTSHVDAIAAISKKRLPRLKQYENLVTVEAASTSSSAIKLKDIVSGFVSTRSNKPPVTQKNQKIEVAVAITNTGPRSLLVPMKIPVPKIAEHASIVGSNEADNSIVNSNQGNGQLQLHQEDEEASSCHGHMEDIEHEGLKDPGTQATDGSIGILDVLCEGEGKMLTSCPNLAMQPQARVSSPLNGKGIPDSSRSSRMETPEARKEDQLTGKEIHLKQILILNQQFLNAAEAFFKLNIPVGILHTTSTINNSVQDEPHSLIINSGYEILKRKGRRQELMTLHPFATATSISFAKVGSLNDLVKQIQRDFEKLESYVVVKGSSECDVEEYLAEMIGKDLYGEDADTNCMWEPGWNGGVSSFIDKDEVIRDIENDLINGLVHEICREICPCECF